MSEEKPSQVHLSLTFVEPHWHCANKRLHSRCRLVIARSEPATYVFVIEDLNWKKHKGNSGTCCVLRHLEHVCMQRHEPNNRKFQRLATEMSFEGKSTIAMLGKIDYFLWLAMTFRGKPIVALLSFSELLHSPALRMWSISSGFWWSSPETEVWCPKFSWGRRGKWCRSWKRSRRWFRVPATGCHCLLFSLCGRFEPWKRFVLFWQIERSEMFRFTFLSQIWRGLLPMEYKIDKKPDWKVFLNISEHFNWAF